MTTKTKIDVTMPQLHKYIKDWQIASVERDATKALYGAIVERWPEDEVGVVLIQAEINALTAERIDQVKGMITDPDRWIDTTVQGDFWNDWDTRCPPYFIVNGEEVPYYEMPLPKQNPFLEALYASMGTEIDALVGAADKKRAQRAKVKKQLDLNLSIIADAIKKGMNPEDLRYARKK